MNSASQGKETAERIRMYLFRWKEPYALHLDDQTDKTFCRRSMSNEQRLLVLVGSGRIPLEGLFAGLSVFLSCIHRVQNSEEIEPISAAYESCPSFIFTYESRVNLTHNLRPSYSDI